MAGVAGVAGVAAIAEALADADAFAEAEALGAEAWAPANAETANRPVTRVAIRFFMLYFSGIYCLDFTDSNESVSLTPRNPCG